MKSIILYASKTGTTEEVAKYIAKQLNNAKIINLSKQKAPKFDNYDMVILGSGIYFGKIHKHLKQFIANNNNLIEKELAIFYCCGNLQQKKRKEYKNKNFNAELQSKAVAVSCVGGKINYSKANFFQKILLVTFLKISRIKKEPQPELDYKVIDKFIEKIK